MKTQISILVKNESLLSRFMSFLWFINIFKKMSVNVWIDDDSGKPHVLTAREKPYVVNVAPGHHDLLFTDPRAKSKQAFKMATGAFAGFAFGLGAGAGMAGAAAGADLFSGAQIRDGVVSCNLNEGDRLNIMVKPKHNGSIKIKILK